MTPNQIGGKTNERLIQRRSVENLGEGRNKPTKTLQMQTFFLPFPFGTLLMQCRFTLCYMMSQSTQCCSKPLARP